MTFAIIACILIFITAALVMTLAAMHVPQQSGRSTIHHFEKEPEKKIRKAS